jgi:hypothetical protein
MNPIVNKYPRIVCPRKRPTRLYEKARELLGMVVADCVCSGHLLALLLPPPSARLLIEGTHPQPHCQINWSISQGRASNLLWYGTVVMNCLCLGHIQALQRRPLPHRLKLGLLKDQSVHTTIQAKKPNWSWALLLWTGYAWDALTLGRAPPHMFDTFDQKQVFAVGRSNN